MNRISHEEAEQLRAIRSRVIATQSELQQLACSLAAACQHEDDECPDCEVCRLYRMASDAHADFVDAPTHLDAALMNGPHPTTRK